jgi:hypothetical protein
MNDQTLNYKPEFHYLQINRRGDKLNILSRRLKTDFSGFDNGYTLTINKP